MAQSRKANKSTSLDRTEKLDHIMTQKVLLFRSNDNLAVSDIAYFLVGQGLLQAASIQSHSSIRSMNSFIRSNCFCSYKLVVLYLRPI